MKLRYLVADVFTDRPFGGNPLAVFPEGAGLDGATMQAIAREMNLSETTFCLPPTAPGCQHAVRIFTPAKELPFAGHPIVGTALALLHLGMVPSGSAAVTLQLGVGPVRVELDAARRFARFHREGAPEIATVPLDPAALASLLSLAPGDVAGPAWEASYGVKFLCIPLRGKAALGRARPDLRAWDMHLAASISRMVFPFCALGRTAEVHDVQARMFAPDAGVPEDPATGSAVAAFIGSATMLADAAGTRRALIAQGVEMGRPSLIEAAAVVAGGRTQRISVGGQAVIVAEGTLSA